MLFIVNTTEGTWGHLRSLILRDAVIYRRVTTVRRQNKRQTGDEKSALTIVKRDHSKRMK